jgi:TIR domain
MEKSDMPLRVFCSFAPEDADFCDQLHDHLRLLERQDRLRFLHSRLIKAGTDWEKVVDEQLANAAIILLLISPAFFASDYCYGVEMQQAMQRHEVGEARVIPILLRPSELDICSFCSSLSPTEHR